MYAAGSSIPGQFSTDLCARTICRSLGVGVAPCLKNSSAIVLRPNPNPSWGRSSDGTNCNPGSKQQSQSASRTSLDHATDGFGRPALLSASSPDRKTFDNSEVND